jgi:dTDP-4-amino-4,6-dideoxygalactose transaminase
LKKLDRMVGRRRHLADLYDRALAPLAPWIRPVPRPSGVQSAFHLYVALVDFEGLKRSRATVMNKLREEGIFSQVHYTPVHLQPYYRAQEPTLRLPGAEAYYARALSLPLFPGMTDAEVDRVVAALCRATGISEATAAGR